MAKKKENKERLGTGLAAIFGDDVISVIDEIQNSARADEYGRRASLKLTDIRSNPYQPRKVFDQEKLEELAQSIRETGVFTPILVREATGGYELIAGERRVKASVLAGKEEIPAIIMDFNDTQMMEISLLENIQREDLNVLEEASGYKKLIKALGYTQEQLANRIGKSREHVSNTLRLLKLPKDVQKLVEENKLSMGHVKCLLTLDDKTISEIAHKAVSEGLSVRQVEALASDKKASKPVKTKADDPYLVDLQNSLQRKFGSKVKITKNSINIFYQDKDELNRLLELLDIID
ncbi:MAG TPA: ParB/RepB/Spo0J family partition protein [Erysipelotrichaceae bacterium]|jgi:ParB family chromosome partitioning protein|nr:ParB/RepB/Spo0J family partition protein [Erysipelotrichaceae bacterium]HQA84835.1 ParB/RepB/Spo0J family partition protein [Erysipelotrichaceae bacterium]